jgi:hypothetical protein
MGGFQRRVQSPVFYRRPSLGPDLRTGSFLYTSNYGTAWNVIEVLRIKAQSVVSKIEGKRRLKRFRESRGRHKNVLGREA